MKLLNQQKSNLEAFVEQFNRLEMEMEVFRRCKDETGVLWWDMVRYAVQHAMAVEKGLFGRHKEPAPSRFMRIKNFLRHIFHLIPFLWNVLRMKNRPIEAMYISTRFLKEAEARMLSENDSILWVNQSGDATFPHYALKKNSLKFLLRILTPLFSVPPRVEKEMAEISAELKKHFSSQVQLERLMRFKYKQSRAALWLWRSILARMPNLKRILFVNDDMLHFLLLLAREKGVETIEVQHGYMGREHFSYRYPELPFDLPTLPDKVWITRDTGDIVYPVEKEYLQRIRPPDMTKHRDIDILIGASPGHFNEMVQMLKTLVGADASIAVKLHPVQKQEYDVLQSMFSKNEVAVYAGEMEFMALAERSYVFIPVSATSTTGFEAKEAGADVILIHYNGNKVTNMCDEIATAAVDNFESLRDEAMAQLMRRKN